MPLDPHAKRFLDRFAAVNPSSTLDLSVNERRDALEYLLSFSAQREEVADIENRSLPGPAGALPIRLYTPTGAPSPVLPGLIFFHGGGLVAGNLDSHDGICRSLANASGFRVIAVDYRLAPESRFPAAIADAHAAVCWIAAHAAELGLDPQRLGVAGDSAGATLAAVVCQMSTATPALHLALQLLLCPILDHGATQGSRRSFGEGYFIDAATLEHDLKHYLPPDADPSDPRISPLHSPELRGLPPTCIHTAEFDPLRDEGEAYAQRLKLAGVPTTYRCHSGMIHLFYAMGALIPYAATAYGLIGADARAMLA